MRFQMRKSLLAIIIAAIGTTFFLMSCTQSTMKMDRVTDRGLAGDEQPCWIDNDPECDDESGEYYYFVGQNAVPEASRARPSRMAGDSAKNGAIKDFAAMIKSQVASKVTETMTAEGDADQGSMPKAKIDSTVSSYVVATTTGLKRADKYQESLAKNSKGIPLWTVWVRMKIKREIADEQIQIQMGKIIKKLKEE
jgi:hypothetical protein